MNDPADMLETYALDDPSVCSRCFSKGKTAQQRRSQPTCGDDCGKLGVTMDSTPVSANKRKHRARNLVSVLTSNGIEIDEDAFLTAIDHYGSTVHPKVLFENAIAFGTGHRDISELQQSEEDETGVKEQDDDTTNSESGPEPTPLEKLAMGPVEGHVINDIQDESVIKEVSMLNTPTSDIYYLNNPHKFKADYGLDEVGDHTAAAVGAAAYQYNSGLESYHVKRWIDQVDDRFKDHILSAAVRHGAPTVLPVDVDIGDSFRSSSFWPAIKRGVAQQILSHIQKHDDEYVETADIAEKTGFDDEVVRRVLYVLYENETVEPDDGAWKYVKDSQFRAEQVPDDR